MSGVETTNLHCHLGAVPKLTLEPGLVVTEENAEPMRSVTLRLLDQLVLHVRRLENPPRVRVGEVECGLVGGRVRVPRGNVVPGDPPVVAVDGGGLLVVDPAVWVLHGCVLRNTGGTSQIRARTGAGYDIAES